MKRLVWYSMINEDSDCAFKAVALGKIINIPFVGKLEQILYRNDYSDQSFCEKLWVRKSKLFDRDNKIKIILW